jgi:membrane protein insertase Oxa1/YidC/SpoIIIJ
LIYCHIVRYNQASQGAKKEVIATPKDGWKILLGLTIAMGILEFIGIGAAFGFKWASIAVLPIIALGIIFSLKIYKMQSSPEKIDAIKGKLKEFTVRIGKEDPITDDELAALREEILKIPDKREEDVWASHFNMTLIMIQAQTGKKPQVAAINRR